MSADGGGGSVFTMLFFALLATAVVSLAAVVVTLGFALRSGNWGRPLRLTAVLCGAVVAIAAAIQAADHRGYEGATVATALGLVLCAALAAWALRTRPTPQP